MSACPICDEFVGEPPHGEIPGRRPGEGQLAHLECELAWLTSKAACDDQDTEPLT